MQLSLDHRRLDLIFIFSMVSLIATPALLPQWHLLFFAPFLVIASYQKSFSTCLWFAFFCGLFLDLLSSNIYLGLHACCFGLTIAILYPQRRHFFADSISTLPILTFYFSLLSTLISAILFYCIESKNVFSWPWMWTDVIVMPMIDAFYAFCCFILPALVIGTKPRKAKDYFSSR